MTRRLIALLVSLLFVSCKGGKTTVEQATKDNILVIGNANEPKGLDPHLVSGVLESNIIRSLFEGLCTEHPSQDGTSLPGAARSWEPNSDFTEWTFHLQPTAKWSDGVPVTSRDFAFAYQRLLTPTLPAKYAEMLYFIKGAKDYHQKNTTDFSTVGISTPDDFTLKITLRGPIPFLPEITKHYTWYPVPRHKILQYGKIDTPFTDWTDEGNLVSNGPFQLKEWKTNRLIEVERNPLYWDKDNVHLNGIRYLPIPNPYTESRMYLDEQMHLTYSLPSEMISYAKEHLPDQIRQEPYVGVNFLRCNITKGPLKKTKVRQALSAAIDRQSIIDNILQGGQKPATGIVPPFGNYQPPIVTHFDKNKAQQLLKESGFSSAGDFPEISILTTPSGKRMAEALQAMWKKNLNLNVRIIQRDWGTYLELQTSLQYDIAIGGWIGDYLDPTTFLEMWIKDGGNNNTGWANPTYEQLLRKAENTADAQARFLTLAEAENVFLLEAPVLPLFFYTTNYLIRPEVKGWSPLLLNNHPFKHVKLEK